jgi:hypothetical protein
MHNKIAKTPPMGWNSWDCYGASVTEAEVKGNAEYIAKHLKKYGWEYVTVDIQWSEPEAGGTEYNNLPRLSMDEYGRLIPAENRFPSATGGKGFKPLADYVHSLGLKFGIHILRGIPRQAAYADCPIMGGGYTAREAALGSSICGWNMDMYGVKPHSEAGQAYYDSILALYAEWGVDFIKVDDMTAMSRVRGEDGQPAMRMSYHEAEAEMYRKAIDKTGRAIVFSGSPGISVTDPHDCVVKNLNMWRISGDFWDSWEPLKRMFDLLTDWNPWMGPGHFPDADMIPIGRLMVRSNTDQNPPRWTNFTRDEHYFLMSLWSIARSPLILGCNLPDLDDFSLSLLSNERVIALNQNSTNNRMVFKREQCGCWAADGSDGCVYVGFFNLSDAGCAAAALLSELGLDGSFEVEDVWTGEKHGTSNTLVAVRLRPHQGTLLRLKKA